MPTAATIAVTALNTNTNADAPELVRPERPDRRSEQQAAHLRRAVQAERLAPPLGRRRVGQEAARRRVVDGRPEPGAARSMMNATARSRPAAGAEHAGRDEADDHQRDARGAVGQPAEDRLADEARGRPGGDDEAERGRDRCPAR